MRGQIRVPERRQPQQPAEGAEQQQPEAPKPELRETKAELPKRQNYKESKEDLPGAAEQRAAASARQSEPQKPMPAKAAPKVGRNDPCPCGSGKKYKNCHGKGL